MILKLARIITVMVIMEDMVMDMATDRATDITNQVQMVAEKLISFFVK